MKVDNNKWYLVTVIVLIIAGLFIFSALSESSKQESRSEIPTDWQAINTTSFTLYLPPEWKFTPLHGMDSQVGEFVGDDMVLKFDYGWYSNTLADEGDPSYTVIYEIIDGRNAKIVTPKGEAGGITGVYFEGIGRNGMNRFQLSGKDLTVEQKETAIRIFRSLRFIEE